MLVVWLVDRERVRENKKSKQYKKKKKHKHNNYNNVYSISLDRLAFILRDFPIYIYITPPLCQLQLNYKLFQKMN